MLQKKFPRANVTIGDSYITVRQIAKRYDLVVLDAGEKMGDRYEHFEMFPYIFRALKPRAVLILNETPRINDPDPERLSQRHDFYRAADPAWVSWGEIRATYQRLGEQNGYCLEHIFFERRWVFAFRSDPMYYCIMVLSALAS
jgi:spermidine synthase